MNCKIVIYLAVHAIVWLISFQVYGAWVRQTISYVRKSIPGLVLGTLCLVTQILPFALATGPDQPTATSGEQEVFGFLALTCTGILLLTGTIRLGSQVMLNRWRARDAARRSLPSVRAPGSLKAWLYRMLWWVLHVHVLTTPLARHIKTALDREEGSGYLATPLEPQGQNPFWPASVGVLLASLAFAAFVARGPEGTPGWPLAARPRLTGLSANGPDPSARFHLLQGQGGLLPHGIQVDTTRTGSQASCATVRFPLGLFDYEKFIPFGAKALRVQFEWEVLQRQDWAVEPPAVKIAASEQGPVNAEGMQLLRTFWTRNVLFAEGGALKGMVELAIQLQTTVRTIPDSKDVIFGPLVFVPPGWRIALRRFGFSLLAPSQVPELPNGEGQSFVAWYNRNERKATVLDLRWCSSSKQEAP